MKWLHNVLVYANKVNFGGKERKWLEGKSDIVKLNNKFVSVELNKKETKGTFMKFSWNENQQQSHESTMYSKLSFNYLQFKYLGKNRQVEIMGFGESTSFETAC
jgi:hypothetical protein